MPASRSRQRFRAGDLGAMILQNVLLESSINWVVPGVEKLISEVHNYGAVDSVRTRIYATETNWLSS